MPRFNAEKTMNKAAAVAEREARELVEALRAEPSADPIVWITSNMPPLRAYGSAETFWQGSGVWSPTYAYAAYAETFEETLTAADVLLDCPEWDNALYVVDLQRWQFVEGSEDSDSLNDEWEPITETGGN